MVIFYIYNYVDETKTVDGKPMYEKINDEWNVVLANRYFNLQSNQTYYVSFAFEDDSVADKTQLAWGKPSDVCSLYSANFQMVQQKVLVTDANGSITTTVTIPCDDNATPEYNIKGWQQRNLPAPDAGSHWTYMGGNYVLITDTEGKILKVYDGEIFYHR